MVKNIAGPARQGMTSPSRADLDGLAAQVLGFLAGDSERLGRFLALTGFDPGELRRAATRPEFSRAVLSYLGSDEGLLVEFAQAEGLDPMRVGALVRWVTEPPEMD